MENERKIIKTHPEGVEPSTHSSGGCRSIHWATGAHTIKYFSISHGCCKVYSAYKNNLAGMPSFTMTLCCVKIIFYGIEIAREGKWFQCLNIKKLLFF